MPFAKAHHGVVPGIHRAHRIYAIERVQCTNLKLWLVCAGLNVLTLSLSHKWIRITHQALAGASFELEQLTADYVDQAPEHRGPEMVPPCRTPNAASG